MEYKVLVLDLDGTLTNRDKIITPKTKKALMQAQEKGIVVVLASGRPTYGIMPLAKELELEKYGGYILSYNGGNIINCKTQELIFERSIPLKENKRIVQLAKEHKVVILTYRNDEIISDDASSPYVMKECQINKLKPVTLENIESSVDFVVPKFLMVEDGDYLSFVEPKIKAQLGSGFLVYRSEPYFLEIMPKGVDKARSLERLLMHLGLDVSQMIACGDGYNDLTMIRYAGLGVAMENAVLPVRQAADFITTSNDDDGIANVIKKYIIV